MPPKDLTSIANANANAVSVVVPVKKAKPIPKELFKFKYFKFKCRDSSHTIEFYKSLGMTVDFDGEQESFKYVPSATTLQGATSNAQKGGGVKTMESNHMKKLLNKDETAAAGSGIDESKSEGGPLGRIFGLSYLPMGNSGAPNRTQLIFEENPEKLIDKRQEVKDTAPVVVVPGGEEGDDEESAKNAAKAKAKALSAVARKEQEAKSKRSYEYLVIYVHFLARVVKRMQSKGFPVKMDVTTFDHVKMAIFTDPNNIEIRLIELPDNYMNEGSAKTWFAKLAYYAIPTAHADATVHHYESLFQVRAPKPATKTAKEKEAKEKEESSSSMANLRKLGPSQTAKNALTKGSGFRIVDMDELVVGLMDTVFYWLGNEMRPAACCICFAEVSNADTGVAFTGYDPEESPLSAIGFDVPNLDMVINKLKHETKDSLVWDPLRYKMAKYGITSSFHDKLNGITLDLLCTKIETVVPVGVKLNQRQLLAQKLLASNAAAGAKKEDNKDEHEFSINLSHLKGHARVLSEGAIYSTMGYGFDLRKETVAPIVEEIVKPAKKEKKLLSMFRDEESVAAGVAASHGSELNLDSSTTKKKNAVKTVLGRTKDADILAVEILLNREKSKSI